MMMRTRLCANLFQKLKLKMLSFRWKKTRHLGLIRYPSNFINAVGTLWKALFNDFHAGKADISRLNYGIITLLPKIKDASKIQQFRPICLLNCLYKLITKVLTIRIEPFAAKLIHNTQTAFMKGRNITSGIMCLHEIMHETKRRKEVGVFFKIDFEKAYDKVSWKLLFDCLQLRDFCSIWCNWIRQVVSGGTVSIKLNNSCGPYIEF